MSYFDTYVTKLNALGGSIAGSLKQSAKDEIINDFKSSPFYFQIDIDGILTDCRVVSTNKSNEKELLFLPETIKNVGEVVTYNNTKWLIIEFFDNEIFPKAIMRQCNQTLTLQTGVTKTQIGTDPMGRPIYEETPAYTSWDCIVDNKIITPDLDEPINLPQGKISVIIPYTDITITLDMQFTMWNDQYQIIGIDKTHTLGTNGIFIIQAQRVVK